MSFDVSIIVPARDAEGTVGACLDALCRQETAASYEIIVVDDGSLDCTAAVAAAKAPTVRIMRRRRADGPGSARNEGAAGAMGRVLAFTDADCEPTSGWLAAGLRALDDAELVIGPVAPVPGVAMGPFDRSLWVSRDDGLYRTANLFVKRHAFERVGGFEDWMSLPAAGGRATRQWARGFGEDTWFGWQVRRAGMRAAYAPDALVHHAVFPGTARRFVSERWRRRFFPALAARIPELRDQFLYRRLFLSRRTALFDLAVVAAAAAAVRRSPWPLLGAVPYSRIVYGRSRPWGRRAAYVAAVEVAGDAVAAAGQTLSSVRARSPVL